MRKFSEFQIKVDLPTFTGNKIKVSKVLNREITVIRFKIEPSKVNSGDCLTLQIQLLDELKIIFTSGGTLLKQIQQVPVEGFPFKTTIVETNERYVFT